MKTLIIPLLAVISLNVLSQSDPYLLKDFKKVNSPATCVAFSADGKSLIAGYNDGSARIINIQDGSYGPAFGEHRKGLKAVEISPNGKFYITAGDNTFKAWSPEGQQLYLNKDMTTTVMSLDLDSTGMFIVAGEFNKTFKLYDAIKGVKIADFRGNTDVAMTVCFDHSGKKVASAAGNGNITIWDRDTQAVLAKLHGQSEDIYALAFSYDGHYLASASKDKTINIYDLKENKLVQILKGHTNQVMDVEFSPDGMHLLSCSFDQTIRAWEFLTGKCIYTYFESKDAVLDIKFSPDGTSFASASFDESIKLWNFSHEIFVDYYYSPQVIGEMEDKVFLPKQKGESRDDYDARHAKALKMKEEIYSRYYAKYLDDLKNGTLPTL